MGLKPKATGKTFDPIPDGVYQAVCFGLYDLGTQWNAHFEKSAHQVLIIWELPELVISFEKNGTKITAPRAISKIYTYSMNEKASLRKDLKGWRNKEFSDQELESFDLVHILGQNCMIQVINTTKGDATYSNVAALLPLYKGVKALKPVAEIQYFSLEDNMDVPENTPDWIRNKIMASSEMKHRVNTPPETDVSDVPLNVGEDTTPF